MSELSEEEDALLAKLLLNTDLVSEESVEMVRDLQSSLRQQGIKVSIVDLLLQSDLLSRSDLNELRSLVNEETEAGDALMPARFEYPFLTQKDLVDRAREQGVISDRTYEQIKDIQERLEEQGITKSGGELLVEQGFVQPEKLQFDETSPGEEFMDKLEESEDDISQPSTASQSQEREREGEISSRSRVMTELDRYVLEELVERGRIDRAQIPKLVEEARKRHTEGSGGSAVQDELRDRGILHPTTERDVLSAAMDRREQAQQWQNQFGNMGPLVVTVALIVCAAGILYAFYGSGDEQTASDSAATGEAVNGTAEKTAATSRPRADEADQQTEDREGQVEDTPSEPEQLLTFEANVGRILAGQNCDCDIRYEGTLVNEVSSSISEDGEVRVSALSTSEPGAYAPGVYVLSCDITERPGSSLPTFPSAFLYPLEEFGPENQSDFNALINGELWGFVTAAALPSSRSNVEENRTSFGRQLRTAIKAITDQWENVKPFLSDEDPDNPQLAAEFRTLYQDTRKLKKRLREFEAYRTFYYPSEREQVMDLMNALPRAVARLMIKQRKQQDMDVPSDLRRMAGSGSGGSIEAIGAVIDTLQGLRERLPGEGESPNPAQFLKPLVREELHKLMQVEVVLRYLSNHSEVQEQALQQDQEMAPYHILSFYKFAYAQISLRSVFLNNTSAYGVFDEETGERIGEVGARMRGRLNQVIRDLVSEFNITLSRKIPESNQYEGNLQEHLRETFRRAGIDQTVLELEQ